MNRQSRLRESRHARKPLVRFTPQILTRAECPSSWAPGHSRVVLHGHAQGTGGGLEHRLDDVWLLRTLKQQADAKC